MKILIAHPYLGQGGSEIVVAHMVQSLSEQHKVTLITMGKGVVEDLNELAGTTLSADKIDIISINLWGLAKVVKGAAALKGAFFSRAVKKYAENFDLVISGYEFLPVGQPSIHYIHGDSPELRYYINRDSGRDAFFYDDRGWLRKTYLYICEVIGGGGYDKLLDQHVFIANSSKTAEAFRKLTGREAEVIHPPIPPIEAGLSWQKRENIIVMIGRIDRSKRIRDAIEIIQNLRHLGFDVKLHIFGFVTDPEYMEELREISKPYKEWIHIGGPLSPQMKQNVLGKARYFLHANSAEPFGIALAEAARAGCLCLAPKGGGYEDFINDADLLYQDKKDAVDKLRKLLSSDQECLNAKQDKLKRCVNDIGGDFARRIPEVVDKFIAVR